MSHLSILLEILSHGEGLPLPEHATEESSGFDLRAAIEGSVLLEPGARFLVPCGFSMKIPKGFEGQIRSRSGLSLNHGIVVLNAPGTIDSDYYGEIKVLLANLGASEFELSRGLRCAQMVISPIQRCNFTVTSCLLEEGDASESRRGTGGFGSTGVD
ncbi:MAG: deoxyuridine 5'-triphosphate nucleotidohydrolase [Alphaproteobacteria bacterium 16-39-46]|nr:MAG: deoxyuridine 5'-triphosphate nucleotidohydrolase [Alphaproteobacteria bacterium 16-39-46]OZA42643.1 MAG: deoxyuridine 5'-triphosphate nucleotidohydrolase [Alphaproteobacteria bacterium 17-39-52]HQS83823.1 dUTP diphosphatase [Alphaproteobacteria bacterium]HQS93679.1 dUTP diphosphatase [Alphaproteobacteria bacterium]